MTAAQQRQYPTRQKSLSVARYSCALSSTHSGQALGCAVGSNLVIGRHGYEANAIRRAVQARAPESRSSARGLKMRDSEPSVPEGETRGHLFECKPNTAVPQTETLSVRRWAKIRRVHVAERSAAISFRRINERFRSIGCSGL